MTQLTMYSAQVNSPELFLTVAHDGATSTIWITGAVPNKLPAAPNLFIIGTDEDAETIFYPTAGVSVGGDNYRFDTVTRHFQGSSKAWDINTSVSRQYTAYDQDTFKNNIEDLVALRRIYDAFVYIDGTSAYAINRNGGTISSGTNHTTVLQETIDYVHSLGGGTIFYCAGIYTLTNLTTYANIKMVGDNKLTIFDFDNLPVTTYAILLGGENSDSSYSSTTHALNVNILSGDTTITLTSGGGASYSAGNWIKVNDTSTYGGGSFKKGELLEIESVLGDVLTLTKPVMNDYAIASTARVRKIYLAEDVGFEDITFKGTGIADEDYWGPMFYCVRGLHVTNCKFYDWCYAAFSCCDSIDVVIDKCSFKDNYMAGAGYSFHPVDACSGVVVSNCDFRGMGRHYISYDPTESSRVVGGYFKDIKVIGCYFEACTQEAINIHPASNEFSTLLVESCIFDGCGEGIETSNCNLTAIGNTFINCPYCIWMGADTSTTDTFTSHRIIGNRFMYPDLTGGDLRAVGTDKSVSNIIIEGNHFESHGIKIHALSKDIIIKGNIFYKPSTFDTSAISMAGTAGNTVDRVIIEGNIFKSWSVGSPIYLYYCNGVEIKNNIITGSRYSEIQSCSNISVKDNFCKDMYSTDAPFYFTYIIGFHQYVNNTIITGSKGVEIQYAPTAGYEMIVDGNMFLNVTNAVYGASLVEISSPYTGLTYAHYVDKTRISQILSILGDCRLLISNNEITGVAIADLTRYTNNLTASSSVATWSGYKGKGVYYDFNGTSHVMRLTDAADENYFTFGNATAGSDTAFSIVAYIKRDASATDRAIVSKYNQDGLNREWIFYIAGATGYPTIQLFDESVDAYIGRRDSTALSTTEWKTLIMTYDGGEIVGGIQIYLDGVSVADATVTAGTYAAMENTTATLVVGGGGSTTPDFLWDGKIAFLAITAKALTADEAWSLNTLIKGMLG